ncbi:MAG: CDP-glycerol glycerophosphotransferase family protein [Bacteroidales bacterium]|nr:CDP-glycerol glycerophosphotransferase family protein [Candidatus Cryptobacteroides aphodequi]
MSSAFKRLRYRCFVVPAAQRKQQIAIQHIRQQGKARVVLLASSLSMWRLEEVRALMLKKPEHFEVHVILAPFARLSEAENEAELGRLREYFVSKGIEYEQADAFSRIDPDIVFYPQFYRGSYAGALRAKDNEQRLLCYSPYGMMFIDEPWQYNSRFHNVAWRIFLQSEAHRQTASKLCFNRASNVCVAGDADSDAFLRPACENVWKGQDGVKRVIWAPHHSFGQSNRLGRDSFLWTAGTMKKLAEEYAGRIQFAFKPHPRLKTELYNHPDWGRERTDEFYAFWQNSGNTQLESGSFTELFKGSDALIHDCNSFLAEYMYTGRPALFLSHDIEKVKAPFSAFGRDAVDAHYLASEAEGIRAFIDDVVLGGKDTMQTRRDAFKDKYLTAGSGLGFAARVVDEIEKSIWPEQR